MDACVQIVQVQKYLKYHTKIRHKREVPGARLDVTADRRNPGRLAELPTASYN